MGIEKGRGREGWEEKGAKINEGRGRRNGQWIGGNHTA